MCAFIWFCRDHSLAHFISPLPCAHWLLLSVTAVRVCECCMWECAHIIAQNCAPDSVVSWILKRQQSDWLFIRERNAQCHLHCQRRLRLQAKCVCCCGRILHYKNDTIFKPYCPHSFRSCFSFFMPFYANWTVWMDHTTPKIHIQASRLMWSATSMGKKTFGIFLVFCFKKNVISCACFCENIVAISFQVKLPVRLLNHQIQFAKTDSQKKWVQTKSKNNKIEIAVFAWQT